MVDRRKIVALLDKKPFEPFRIDMSDGAAFYVTNRKLVVPMETQLFLAIPNDRWKFVIV